MGVAASLGHAACAPEPATKETSRATSAIASVQGTGVALLIQNKDLTTPTAMITDGKSRTFADFAPSADLKEFDLVGSGDFDGDGHGDLLWRHLATNNVGYWKMRGSGVVNNNVPTAAIAPTLRDGSAPKTFLADMNQDGRSDIVWVGEREAKAIGTACKDLLGTPVPAYWHEVWTMPAQAGGPVTVTRRRTCGALLAVGQFDGKGGLDLLARKNSDPTSIEMNYVMADGSKVWSPVLRFSWRLGGIGDFNRDGQSDLVWHNTDGTVMVWLVSEGTTAMTTLTPVSPQVWTLTTLADVNADGVSDLLWRNEAADQISIWTMTANLKVASANVQQLGRLLTIKGVIDSPSPWGSVGLSGWWYTQGGDADCGQGTTVTISDTDGVALHSWPTSSLAFSGKGGNLCSAFTSFGGPAGAYQVTTSRGASIMVNVLPYGNRDIEYCASPGKCNPPPSSQPTSFSDPATLEMWAGLPAGPAQDGPIWYAGFFPAAGSRTGKITTIGPKLTSVDFPHDLDTDNCGDESKIVRLSAGQFLSASQAAQVFGTSDFRFPASLVACRNSFTHDGTTIELTVKGVKDP